MRFWKGRGRLVKLSDLSPIIIENSRSCRIVLPGSLRQCWGGSMDPLERTILQEGQEADTDDLRVPHPDDVSEAGSEPDDARNSGALEEKAAEARCVAVWLWLWLCACFCCGVARDGRLVVSFSRPSDAPPINTDGMPATLANALKGNSKNTGPKGVIEDYMREERRKQVQRERLAMERDAMIRRGAYGATTDLPSDSYNATKAVRNAVAEVCARLASPRLGRGVVLTCGVVWQGGGAGTGAGAGADDAGSGDDEADGDDFFAEYRRKRLEQMKAAAGRLVGWQTPPSWCAMVPSHSTWIFQAIVRR